MWIRRLALVAVCAALLARAARLTPETLAIDDDATREERLAYTFLYNNMPEADKADKQLGFASFIAPQTRMALQARADNDWATDGVPWNIFLNYVLPYANLDEPREDWRSLFYSKFAPLVADTTGPLEAAMELNDRIWTLDGWNISFRSAQTPEIMAPSQVIAHGYASCTGLAIFLVNACRAVGIPARVAGTPEWTESGGNHDWVEVWQDGVWSFTGPIEYTEPPHTWNRTWFFPGAVGKAVPGSFKHGVYGASFKRTGKIFPLAWRDDYESSVPAYDISQYYVDAAAAVAPSEVDAAVAGDRAGGGAEGGTAERPIDVRPSSQS